MYGNQQDDLGDNFFRERIRELAQKQARAAQWLPDDVDDSNEELDYSHLGRQHFDAMKMQHRMDRMRNEHEARAMTMQQEAERRRQAAEDMVRESEKRRRALEQMRSEMQRSSEIRAAAQLRAENMQKQHQQAHNSSAATDRSSVPINVHRTSDGQSVPSASRPTAHPNPEPKSKSKSQSPPKPVYTEKHETAASVIQHKFRIHRSLRTIREIASEFETLKSAFVYPSVIDFQKPGSEDGHISVSTTHSPSEFDEVEEVAEEQGETPMEVDESQPKLAYTSDNYPIHSYLEAMEKLLMRLDGVESWGDKGVRRDRRSVVIEIGKESAKLERYWKQAWVDYLKKLQEETIKEGEEQEVRAELQETTEIDSEPVYVEHSDVEDSEEWLDVTES